MFYENYIATLVAMATVHEKSKESNDISSETRQPILIKFHI